MVFVICYVSVGSSKDKVFWASALLTVVLQGCAQCDNMNSILRCFYNKERRRWCSSIVQQVVCSSFLWQIAKLQRKMMHRYMLCKSCELRTKFFIDVIRVSDNISSFATQQFIRLNLDKNKIFMQIDQLLLSFQRLSEIAYTLETLNNIE